jgi:peptide/nickel transport system permease protein
MTDAAENAVDTPETSTPKKKKTQRNSQFYEAMRRLKRNRLAMFALCTLGVIFVSAVFADFIAPYDYAKQDFSSRMVSPGIEHIMGTDNFGRDLFSRILKGGQISLLVSFVAVGASMTVGVTLGAVAAYFGKIYDTLIMRFIDIIMGIPSFLLAIAVSTVLGTGVGKAAIAISIGSIPSFTRIVYSTVLSIKSQEFIEAAVATGAKHTRIIFRYILPNTLAPIIVQATMRLGICIMQISSLSFIGLGVQPPTPEWGSILSSGRMYIRDYWPIVTFPGLAIALTLISFNLLGDGLRDALDPRLKQ